LFGRWWDKDLEADIVGINKEKKKIIIGEVKFMHLTKQEIHAIIKDLKEKAKKINTFGFEEEFIIVCLECKEKIDSVEGLTIINFKNLID
jgi:AAA+ ATPase superfamily predicted ATPase